MPLPPSRFSPTLGILIRALSHALWYLPPSAANWRLARPSIRDTPVGRTMRPSAIFLLPATAALLLVAFPVVSGKSVQFKPGNLFLVPAQIADVGLLPSLNSGS